MYLSQIIIHKFMIKLHKNANFLAFSTNLQKARIINIAQNQEIKLLNFFSQNTSDNYGNIVKEGINIKIQHY